MPRLQKKSYITAKQFHQQMFKMFPTVTHENRELLRHFLDKNMDDRCAATRRVVFANS